MTLILALLLALWPVVASAQYVTGAPVSTLSNPVTSGQGGLGGDFSASTGVLYDAAGTFSAIACTSGLLQGGAPPTCTTTPALGTPASGVATNLTGTAAGLTAGLASALAADPADCAAGQVALGIVASGAATCTATPTVTTVTATTSATVGASTPTAITNIRVYAASLTPAQLAAAVGATEETFTVTGLTTADKVIVNGPAPTALCPSVAYRVSAADTLAITFVDLTIALCTPAAGTYNIVAIRS